MPAQKKIFNDSHMINSVISRISDWFLKNTLPGKINPQKKSSGKN